MTKQSGTPAEFVPDDLHAPSQLQLKPFFAPGGEAWQSVSLAEIPVNLSDSVSIPAPQWHMINLAPLHPEGTIEWVDSSCDGKQQRQNRIRGGGFQSILPQGITSRLEWKQAIFGSCLHIYIHPRWLTQAAEQAQSDPARIELVPSPFLDDPTLNYLGLALRSAAAGPASGDALLIETLSASLGMYLVKRFGVFTKYSFGGQGVLTPRQLQRVLDYLQANLGSALSLDRLAAVLSLSPYHFARLFKQSTGLSPHQYVLQERIRKAKQLLGSKHVPLSEIGIELGFSSQAHFTTAFVKQTGVTPRTYRNEL